jgi:hypothetical protein
MKTLIFTMFLVLATKSSDAQGIQVAAPITDFALQDMSGRNVTFPMPNGSVTVVIFFSTRCPMSNAFNYRRNKLYDDFVGRAKFIVVDSNSNESLEEVRSYARVLQFDVPVFKDVNNVVADRFGAQVTTDTFVFDSSGVMRYHGYLEDSPNPTRAKTQALRLALEAVLEGRLVPNPETKALGCSIRRLRNTASTVTSITVP